MAELDLDWEDWYEGVTELGIFLAGVGRVGIELLLPVVRILGSRIYSVLIALSLCFVKISA